MPYSSNCVLAKFRCWLALIISETVHMTNVHQGLWYWNNILQKFRSIGIRDGTFSSPHRHKRWWIMGKQCTLQLALYGAFYCHWTSKLSFTLYTMHRILSVIPGTLFLNNTWTSFKAKMMFPFVIGLLNPFMQNVCDHSWFFLRWCIIPSWRHIIKQIMCLLNLQKLYIVFNHLLPTFNMLFSHQWKTIGWKTTFFLNKHLNIVP